MLAPACSSAKRTIAGGWRLERLPAGVWPWVAPPAAPVAAAVGGELACTPGELAASAAASMVWSAAARSAAAGVAAGEVGCAIGGRRPLPPFRLPEPLTTAVTKPSSFSGVASKLGQSLRGHAAHLLSHRGRWCRRAAGKGILDARSEGHERRVGHEQMLVIEQRHDGHTHTQRHFVHLRQLLAALVHSFELFDGLVQRGFVRGVLG